MGESFTEHIFSIIIYLLCAVISSAFIYKGLKMRAKKQGGSFMILIGILIPSILAGIRYGVGADYYSYLNMYDNAVNGQQLFFRSIEPASAAIIKISAMLRSSFLMFFSFSFITNLCSFLAFRRIFDKDSKAIFLTMLFYLCIIFPTTLNAVRSGASIAFTTLAFSYLIEEWSKKSVVKSLIFIAIAVMFHNSALLGLLFIPVFKFAKRKPDEKVTLKRGLLRIIYILFAVLAPFIYERVGEFLPMGDYARYLADFGDDFSVPIANIVMSVPIIYSALYLKANKNKSENQRFEELVYCALFYIPLFILAGWLTYKGGLSRVSFILDPVIVCLMSYLIICSKKMDKTWRLITVVCVLLVASSMFIRNLYWSQDLPYRTIFQEEISYATKN